MCTCFRVFPTEEFASWTFVNCFVNCFDIGGLAKNKEGKGPWVALITCTSEIESTFDNEKCADISKRGD